MRCQGELLVGMRSFLYDYSLCAEVSFWCPNALHMLMWLEPLPCCA